ncbi:MAG TPA: response regulator [Methylomirabilota bacterium]|nr:response regulator [Methylomirabilota bacterium]
MRNDVVILIADDDPGHVRLIEKNLLRAGLGNRIECFDNGQAILDFLFGRDPGRRLCDDTPYLLLLDVRMPKVDGTEVLRQIKGHPGLRKLPVIMLTTMDDPREVERCHALGCNNYLVKPVDYDRFAEAIRQLGLFVSLVRIPDLDGRG